MMEKDARLLSSEIADFLSDRTLYAFEPDTLKRVAKVTYNADGTCRTEFETGGGDRGVWGISGDMYWTRYATFRDGTTNTFTLIWVAQDVAQAYFGDGTIAFLQSGRADLSGDHSDDA